MRRHHHLPRLGTGMPRSLTARVGLSAVGILGMAACTAGSPEGEGTVTVTVTPTGTASGTLTETPSIPPSSPRPPASEVKGRAFDFGAIVSVARSGGIDVLRFDRWTVAGLDDAKLAAEGLVLRPHTDRPYSNQNPRAYVVPVRDDAAFTYRHCSSADQPVTAETVTLADMAALRGDERLMLLTLDEQGWVLRGENDPACPAGATS